MKTTDLRKRLERLKGSAGNDAELTFTDGQTVGIQCRDALGLTLAGMRRQYAIDSGEEIPVSRFDSKLNLLARAETVTTDDPLLQLAAGVAREGRTRQ